MLKRLIMLCALTATMHGQAVWFGTNVTQPASNVPPGASAQVYTVPNAIISICGYPAVGSPCTNTVPIFSDPAMTQPMDQPISADALGRFGGWIIPGQYSESIQQKNGKFVADIPLSIGALNTQNFVTDYPGSDIGAQINAAYAALPATGGTLIIPAGGGCYAFTTPVVFGTSGKVPMLIGQGGRTCIQYTGTTGTAITFNAGGGVPQHTMGYGIRDIQLVGINNDLPPPVGATPTGILLGGSNGGEGFHMEGAMVSGFGLGITFSDNTFNINFLHSIFINSNQNLLWPAGLTNAGERIDFQSATFARSTTTNQAGCITINSEAGIDFSFTGGNFDSCQLRVISSGPNLGIVSLHGTWMENPAGTMSIPFISQEGGVVITDGVKIFPDAGAPAVPFSSTGGGGFSAHQTHRFGGGTFTALVQTDGNTSVDVVALPSENLTTGPLVISTVDSGVSVVSDSYGTTKQPNFFYTSATPGMAICNGPGGSADDCASFDRGALWSAKWSGTARAYTPMGIRSLGLDSLGFCRADGFKWLGAFNDNGLDCSTDNLTSHVMNVGVGYSINSKALFRNGEKPITADGDVVVATLNPNSAMFGGLFTLIWRPIAGGSANRQQEMTVFIEAAPFDAAVSVNVVSNRAFSGSAVITNPRVQTDGSGNLQFVVTMGNRNSGNNQDTLQAIYQGDLHGLATLFPVASVLGTAVPSFGIQQGPDGSALIPSLKSITGTRFICIDTAGKLISSASACSGT